MAVDAEWARDGKSHDSGSVISGLSSVDDDTDEFGRMLVRHVRDEQRLTSTINGNGQAFRKARSNPRISAALDQLNDTPGRRLLSSGASDPGVVEHALASPSPPLNIPRDWGRKARQNNDWLRRLGTDDTGTRRPLSANAVATLTRPTHDDDHEFVDWAGAAAQPVRSVEEETPTSSEKRHVIHSHSPGRKLRANDSIDRIRQWETEQDFTAGSIIQSTPPFLSRNNRIQELERIQGRAIATDRLSRISERDTPQSVKDRLESRLSRTSAQPLIRRRKTSPNEKLLNDPHARSSNMGNDASGRHELDRKSSMPTVVSASQVVSRGAGERPANGRNDSLQLLKRLARVTSQSSSPSANDKPVLESDYARAQAETTKRFKRQSSAQAPEVVPSTGMDQVQATPRVPVALSAKTPKVMGAWVDTPHTVRHDSAHPPSPKVHKEVKLPPVMSSEQSKELLPEQSLLQRALSAPSQSRPPSALHNLLHPIESSPKKELNVGDETLASLEGLLDPTATLTELSATLNLEDLRAQIATLHSSGRPLSKADNERRDELLAIEAMSERLRAARKGVREVGRGLRNVERQVDDFADNTGKSFGRGGRCEVCRRGVWRAAADEVLGLFVRPAGLRDDSRPFWIRGLTWLGTLLLTAATWFLLENWACAVYCKPRYASSMKGYGVAPNAPHYPFVLPTLIFGPARWIWQPLLWLASNLGSATWTYLSIPFEEEAVRPSASAKTIAPSMTVAPLPVRSVPIHQDRFPRPISAQQEDFQLRALRDASQETMDSDSVIHDKQRFGFAKLWSWMASPAESSVPVQADDTSDDFWTETEAGREPWPGAHEEEQVRIGDTTGLWETDDVAGMSGDEIL